MPGVLGRESKAIDHGRMPELAQEHGTYIADAFTVGLLSEWTVTGSKEGYRERNPSAVGRTSPWVCPGFLAKVIAKAVAVPLCSESSPALGR